MFCCLLLALHFLMLHVFFWITKGLIFFTSQCQVFTNKSLLHRFCSDILQCIWCARILANFVVLLVSALHFDNEKADNAHDQIQICSIHSWQAGKMYKITILYLFYIIDNTVLFMLCSFIAFPQSLDIFFKWLKQIFSLTSHSLFLFYSALHWEESSFCWWCKRCQTLRFQVD